jgi:phosphohistidine swiveling domain-containing protein
MEKKVQKIEPAEEYSHYEFTQEDVESTFWVWDRGHTPPGIPWTPMFVCWWFYGVNGCMAQAHEDMPLPFSKGPRAHSLRGYHMVTIASPQEHEKKERAERYKEAVRPWLENPEKILKQAETELMGLYDKFKKHDYEKATSGELIQWVADMKHLCHRHWYWHYYCMASTGIVYQDWESLSRELLGIDGYHPQFQKLMRGYDNRNFEADRRKFKIAKRIIELGLKDLVLSSKPEEIIPSLNKSEKGKKVVAELNAFLDEFGWRNAMMMSFDTPSWREDPTPVLMHIKQFVANPVFVLDETIAKQAQERKKLEEETIKKLPIDQREWYRILMKAGQNCSIFAEDHSFYMEFYAHAISRYFWLQVGKKITKAGALEKPDDIFFLVPDEVLNILSDPYVFSGKTIVNRRKADWEKAKKFTPEFYYGPFPFEEAMGKLMGTRDVVMVQTVAGRPPIPRPELKADLLGIIGSPGIAEGPARVIFSPAQLGEVRPGEILVAPFTDATWTPAFSLIKGAVVDSGAPMAHAAIICREYGIPAILNTMEGTSKIKTGQRIKVDAEIGAVYILK